MSLDDTPLSDAERAELEQLRAEKQAREEAERARAERAELEQLRAERTGSARSRPDVRETPDEVQRLRESRERARRFMEPDEDLSMPMGQRIVLVVLAVIVLVIIAVILFGPH